MRNPRDQWVGCPLHRSRRHPATGGGRWAILLSILLGILPALISTGCTDGEASAPDQMTIAIQDEAQTLDPHDALDAASMRLIENLYSTLLRYSKEYGEVEPDLAEAYEVSEDGLTYTFHLRKGVRFHFSGRELGAEDVKYSIARIRERQIRADQFAAVESIHTPTPHTLVLRLSEPFAPLLLHLANPMNAIVDRQVVDANGGSLRQADAGSGPFQLLERKRGRYTIVERNPHYYLPDRPYLRRITYRPISDETARTIALRRGEVDLVLDLAAKDVVLVQGADRIRIDAARPGTFWEYIGLNTAREPLHDRRIRQAIAHAIDRDAINCVVKLGRATVIDGGPIRPGYWAYGNLHIYPKRDLEKCRRLLQEAGYPHGFATTLKVGSAFPYQVDAAQMVKQQLQDVGIEVRIQALESSLFFDALNRGDFDMTVVGWVGFVDPDDWTYNLFHTRGKFNQQRYSNPRVDALLEQGRRTLDRAQRKEIYTEAQRLIATDAPMAFLYLNDQISAYSDRLAGYHVHPTATTLWLRETYLRR